MLKAMENMTGQQKETSLSTVDAVHRLGHLQTVMIDSINPIEKAASHMAAVQESNAKTIPKSNIQGIQRYVPDPQLSNGRAIQNQTADINDSNVKPIESVTNRPAALQESMNEADQTSTAQAVAGRQLNVKVIQTATERVAGMQSSNVQATMTAADRITDLNESNAAAVIKAVDRLAALQESNMKANQISTQSTIKAIQDATSRMTAFQAAGTTASQKCIADLKESNAKAIEKAVAAN